MKFELRMMSVNVLLGATNVSITRSTWLNGGVVGSTGGVTAVLMCESSSCKVNGYIPTNDRTKSCTRENGVAQHSTPHSTQQPKIFLLSVFDPRLVLNYP